MRDTRHCAHLIKPPAEEECARLPCPSFWQETGWSNCTAGDSQGDSGPCQGSRRLSFHCPASRQHLCGPRPPPNIASCQAQVVQTTFCCKNLLEFTLLIIRGVRNPSAVGTNPSYVLTRFQCSLFLIFLLLTKNLPRCCSATAPFLHIRLGVANPAPNDLQQLLG